MADQPTEQYPIDSQPLDLRLVFNQSRLFIVAFTVLSIVAAVVYVKVRTPKWRGRSTILVITPDLSRGAAQLAVLSQTASTPLRTIKGVMTSNRAEEAIIDRFKLNYREFDADFKVTDESQTNQLVLEYISTDKAKILDVLSYSIKQLGELDESLNFSVGKRQASTLKVAVERKTAEVVAAEAELLKFQKGMKTASDPANPKSAVVYLEQLRVAEFELGGVRLQLESLRKQLNQSVKIDAIPASIPGAKVWMERLSELEYDLRVARTKYEEEYPEVVRLRSALAGARAQFRQEIQKYLRTVNSNLDPNLAELEAKRILLEYQVSKAREFANVAPDEALQLSRKVIEVTTLRTVLSQLRGQYEQARVESEVGKVRWNVLDYPYIEREPSNKSLKIPVGGAAILGFTLAMSLSALFKRRRP